MRRQRSRRCRQSGFTRGRRCSAGRTDRRPVACGSPKEPSAAGWKRVLDGGQPREHSVGQGSWAMKRARGEGRLFRPCYQGKDGSVRRSRVWWLQFTDPSRPKGRQQVRESSQSTRRTEAARLLQQRLELIRQGRPAGPDVDRVTLGALPDGLVAEYQDNER